MPVYIDCYNVLHQPMPQNLAGLDEAGLCRGLATSRFAGDQIYVVCDGAPKPHALQSPVEQVQLVYSGKSSSADQYIMDAIARATSPRRLWVISSDLEIIRAAKRRRAHTLSSQDLIAMLARGGKMTTAGKGKRSEQLSQDQVRRWLKEFGLETDEKQTPADDEMKALDQWLDSQVSPPRGKGRHKRS